MKINESVNINFFEKKSRVWTNPPITPPLSFEWEHSAPLNLTLTNMIEKLLPQFGGVLTQKRESLWATTEFIATPEDVAHGCTVGKTYVLWVAQKEGTTQRGSSVKKGDWFTVEKA